MLLKKDFILHIILHNDKLFSFFHDVHLLLTMPSKEIKGDTPAPYNWSQAIIIKFSHHNI